MDLSAQALVKSATMPMQTTLTFVQTVAKLLYAEMASSVLPMEKNAIKTPVPKAHANLTVL
jgi:uracil phosphoribosyltransferase